MPWAAKHPCAKRDCPNLVEKGERFCPEHKKEYERAYARARPTSNQRGYNARWQRYRRQFLKNHPYCVNANNPDFPNCDVIATEVDHIFAVKGPHDPMFWNVNNHQAMCKRCHSSKTAKRDGRWGKK